MARKLTFVAVLEEGELNERIQEIGPGFMTQEFELTLGAGKVKVLWISDEPACADEAL